MEKLVSKNVIRRFGSGDKFNLFNLYTDSILSLVSDTEPIDDRKNEEYLRKLIEYKQKVDSLKLRFNTQSNNDNMIGVEYVSPFGKHRIIKEVSPLGREYSPVNSTFQTKNGNFYLHANNGKWYLTNLIDPSSDYLSTFEYLRNITTNLKRQQKTPKEQGRSNIEKKINSASALARRKQNAIDRYRLALAENIRKNEELIKSFAIANDTTNRNDTIRRNTNTLRSDTSSYNHYADSILSTVPLLPDTIATPNTIVTPDTIVVQPDTIITQLPDTIAIAPTDTIPSAVVPLNNDTIAALSQADSTAIDSTGVDTLRVHPMSLRLMLMIDKFRHPIIRNSKRPTNNNSTISLLKFFDLISSSINNLIGSRQNSELSVIKVGNQYYLDRGNGTVTPLHRTQAVGRRKSVVDNGTTYYYNPNIILKANKDILKVIDHKNAISLPSDKSSKYASLLSQLPEWKNYNIENVELDILNGNYGKLRWNFDNNLTNRNSKGKSHSLSNTSLGNTNLQLPHITVPSIIDNPDFRYTAPVQTTEPQELTTTTTLITSNQRQNIGIDLDMMKSEIKAYYEKYGIKGINSVEDIDRLEPWQILDVFHQILDIYYSQAGVPVLEVSQQLTKFVPSHTPNIPLSRAEIRALIEKDLGINPYNLTAKLRRALRKYINGDKDLDVSWVDKNSELYNNFIAPFTVYLKRNGGRLLSKSPIKRFKNNG